MKVNNAVNTKVKELGEFIRSQRASTQMSLRKLAKVAGVSNPYLSQVERGLRRPSAEMLQAIAKALRVSSQTLYVKAGILEDEPHPDVHTAVLADPTLTEQQKQVLLQVYDSFRDETGRRRTTPKTPAKKRASTPEARTAKTSSTVTKLPKTSTARTPSRRSTKHGGRAEMQADPSPHPAPLRPLAANRTRITPTKPGKEVG